jgi:hypothetical protein
MSDQSTFKTIVALSQAFDDQLPVELNALAHLTQSIGHQTAHRRLGQYTCYHDATGASLGLLSWWPVIVLSGRPQRIGQLWSSLQAHDWPRVCFVETMIRGGSEAQLMETSATKLEDAKIVALAAFGPSEPLNVLTKKLSLWRPPSTAPRLQPVAAA